MIESVKIHSCFLKPVSQGITLYDSVIFFLKKFRIGRTNTADHHQHWNICMKELSYLPADITKFQILKKRG